MPILLSSVHSVVCASIDAFVAGRKKRRGHHQQARNEIHTLGLGAATPIATIGAEAASTVVCGNVGRRKVVSSSLGDRRICSYELHFVLCKLIKYNFTLNQYVFITPIESP